ncbi:MAG: hypothetical protein LBV76_00700 [Deltaproteobacteria bacterium]|jgi:hypothetical protein|nr:hypothetical protein [Deltaproteobacteria bacterium]
MPATLKQKVEGYLYRRGFTEPILREVMLAQLAVTAVAAVLTIVFIWLTSWFLLFFVGAALVTCNFWFLCQFIFKRFSEGYSKNFVLGQVLLFSGRFVLTGLILAAALLFGGSPSAILAGLGTCVTVIIVRSLLRV